MIYAFSGWRGWWDKSFIQDIVFRVAMDTENKIRVGDCPTGADEIIRQYLNDIGCPSKRYVADWRGYGKAAGPLRNRDMLTDYHRELADVLIAFPEPGKGMTSGSGTWDCIGAAQELGIEVVIPGYKKASPS